MKLGLHLCFSFSVFLVAAIAQAGEDTPQIISDLPIGKLAFVTGDSFGSPGTISVIGQRTEPFDGLNPQFTADSRYLMYHNSTGMGTALFIRDLTGNASRKIANQAKRADSPALSPNASKLLFVAWPADQESSHIYVSDPDGSEWLPLTAGKHFNWSPSWSPDGTRVLFETTRDNERQIYVMDADGKNQTNLTNNKVLSHAPAWSPDGSRVAYMSRGESKKSNIFTMKSDGTDKKNVSNGKSRDSEPAWSPDGEWIAFTRTAHLQPDPDPDSDIMDLWIMKNDGSQQRQLTRNKEGMSSWHPSWSR